MNKKISLFTIGLISLISLTSCNDSINQKILNSFNDLNTKIVMVKSTTNIKKENVLIASEEVNYNFATNEKETITKTLNPITEDTAWHIETIKANFTISSKKSKLKESNFDELTLIGKVLSGTIKNDNILDVFGVEKSNIKGDVFIQFSIDSIETLNINNVSLNYVSNNGNDVSIINEYTFKDID